MRAFRVAAFAALLFSLATTATAQYAETPRQLPAVNGYIRSAVQIGNRLFVAGLFTRLSEPTGGAVVVSTTDGAPMPGAFPVFTGNVRAIVPDNLGGYLVGGDFTSAGGQPIARFARVRPDRTIDPSYHLTADGTIYIIVVAHGRIYLGGSFSTINGAPRPGVAALEATTGRLTTFGAGFASSANVTIRRLAVSSNGIYVAGNDASGAGHLWGFDAGTGRMLFDRGLAVNALAATSDRVYVGTYGATRPVFAVDPRTGGDVPWETSLRFVPIYGTYGDYTSVSQLLLDGSRLYLAGYFRTTDGRENLTAIEASSGQAVSWHPSGAPPHSTGLTRVGPAIVTTFSSGAVLYDWRHVAAYHVDTAALDPWDPRPYGSIQAVAAATDGVVIGGDFNGIGGVERGPIASIDLDTGAIEPWTAASLPGGGPSYDLKLITDGTHIIASYGARTLAKIDAVSGALLGLLELDMGSSLLARVAGDRVAVVQSRGDGVPLVTTVSIDDWSRHDLPTAFSATTFVQAMDVAGNQLYLAGTFSSVNGTRRDGLAAVNLDTGALSSWNPAADATAYWLRVAEGRVWVAGRFRRIGGAWRRGVAALDPATGAATTWNPDVPFGTFMAGDDRIGSTSIGGMEAAADGYVYLTVSGTPAASVSGQPVNGIVALSMATGKRLPWSPPFTDWTAIVPGCLLQGGAICYPPAISSPTELTVQQSGSSVTFNWTAPDGGPTRTAVRLQAGSAEGRSDLTQIDLPPGQTTFTTPVPRGAYFVRLRSIAGTEISLPTPDVSLVVGPPDVPAAPLDLTAITEGQRLTLAWRAPSTGAPAGYLFEAGTAPGGRNVAALPIASGSTSLSLDAPAGRFYGRLVPVNANGRGPSSNEVVLDIAVTGACTQPPDPPSGLASQVSGRTVTLSWQLSTIGAIPAGLHLVAGTAPGSSNLGTIPLAATATGFSIAVPPGTYYVRVATVNSCGVSAFSNEVQLTVS